jgi:hypothetical protein
LERRLIQSAQAAGKSEREIVALVRNYISLSKILGSTYEAYKLLISNQERANRIARESATALGIFRKEAEALGLVLESDVTAEIKKNNEVLEAMKTAIDGVTVTWEDYERAQIKVAAKNAELRASIAGVKEETDGTAEAIHGYGNEAEEAAGKMDALTAANDRQLQSQRRLQLERHGSRLTTSPDDPLITGGGPSGGVFTVVTRTPQVGPGGRINT